jgi:hypothetical protein
MGIGVDLARALLREGVRRKFEGKIISLGVQDIFLNAPMLKAILNEFKIDSKVLIELSAKGGLAKDGFISDVSFFKSIGFNDLLRIDATDYEGADIVFDLNCKIRSAESNDGEDALNDVVGAADVVLNGGTVEHVFNVPVALENTFKLLKIGGRVIHTAPCSNHIDHGFYMFSPTFFNDYYLANKFELNDFKIIKYWPDVDKRWETLDYVPGILTDISMGGLTTPCMQSTLLRRSERSQPEMLFLSKVCMQNICGSSAIRVIDQRNSFHMTQSKVI